MIIKTDPRDDHQITMTVSLEHETLEGAKRRAARKLSERKTIPGFRPGKAPYDVMVRTFGESVILDEAVDLLLAEIYPKALEEAKIEPGAPGSLEKMENLETAPKFIFTVPLAPIVKLGNYHSVQIPYDWKPPREKELENALDDLRHMYAKTESVDRPAEIGDFLLVDVTGGSNTTNKDNAPLISRTGFPVFLRKDEKLDEWPFMGFSRKLIGASANETRTFSHKYPADHDDEAVKGQTLKFSVLVKMIRGSILPELNDEFAKQIGPFSNVEALRESVKANLISRSKGEYDDDYFNKVIEAIKAGGEILYAPQTLEHESNHVLEDIKSRLAKQGMDLPAYLKSRELDEESFLEKEVRPAAAKRLERSLLLDEFSRAEKIEVSKEMMDASFQNTLNEVAGSQDFQKYMKGKSQPPKQIINAVAMESANRAYLQQILERMKEIATGQASGKLKKSTKGDSSKRATKTSATPKKTKSVKESIKSKDRT